MRANWLYFLGPKNNKQELFVYGLSLETQNSHIYNKLYKLGKVGDKILYLFESISQDIQHTEFDTGTINLNLFHEQLSQSIKIEHINKYIQNQDLDSEIPTSPINQTVYMNVFYTFLFHEYDNGLFLDEENKSQLLELLRLLQENSSQNFKDAYFERLGCFEFGETMPWAETSTPFSISNAKTIPNTYKITRKEEYKNEEYTVHLIVTSIDENILLDEIKTFKKGHTDLIFDTPIINDAGFEYSVFNTDGKLIHKDKGHWMLGISIQISSGGTPVNLKKIEKGKEKNIVVSAYSPTSPIEIKYPDDKNIQKVKSNIRIIKSICKTKTIKPVQKWFDKNENSIEDIMKYLNEFLTGMTNSIIFIDPFFSAEALWALSQINNTNTNINVISCWGNIDPDTGENTTLEQNIQKVIEFVNKISEINLPVGKLIWHNLGSENFHDRYILISNNGKERVFSIPNSMNNLLKKYNFTILELTDYTRENALKYLHEIIGKCNENNRIIPEVKDV